LAEAAQSTNDTINVQLIDTVRSHLCTSCLYQIKMDNS
jgi:hypothetical protein